MRARLLALTALPVLLAAGCAQAVAGTASPAPSVLLADLPGGAQTPSVAGSRGQVLLDVAASALQEAGSAHVHGSTVMDGEQLGIDLQLCGDDAVGSVTLSGATIQLVVAGGDVFFRAPADFWLTSGLPEDAVGVLAEGWVRMPTGTSTDAPTLAYFVDELRSGEAGDVVDAPVRDDLDGMPVWVLANADGSRLFIAAQGAPYPVQEVDPDGGVLTIDGFGAGQPILPPADYLDLDDYGA